MSMIIRPAQLSDYDDFCELMAQIDKYHRDEYPDIFREAHPVRTREYFSDVLNDDTEHILVAEIDGQVVGSVQWLVSFARELPILQPRTALKIETLVVHDDFRRQGIGRKLMTKVEEWARAHQISNLELGVWLFNESAIKFYESLGYSMYRARMSHKLDL